MKRGLRAPARHAKVQITMKLYTKTGDDGTTGLFGGARVPKASPRVDAYGTVDETNATVGLARAAPLDPAIDVVLARVQEDLFTLGAELACAPGREAKLGMALIGAADIERLEHAIDEADAACPPLKSFVLPGGTPQAAALHLARTVCRRAERAVLALLAEPAEPGEGPAGGEGHDAGEPARREIVVYLNRLSDLLFALARRANGIANVPDVPWKPRG
jgi:cob(I)alamin adenosyltransferase